MKHIIPNKIGRTAQSAIMDPLTIALIALRRDRATAEHYHDLAGALSIAFRAAELVPRHRYLIDGLQPGLDALNAIFARSQQRTVDDAFWNGTPKEVDDIENGVKIYHAIVRTTPTKVMLRAITRMQQDTAVEEHA